MLMSTSHDIIVFDNFNAGCVLFQYFSTLVGEGGSDESTLLAQEQCQGGFESKPP